MDQMNPKIPGRWRWWLAATFVLLVIVSTALAWRVWGTPKSSSYETSPATRGSLTNEVEATGTLRAAQSVTLVWKTSGRVENVAVSNGAQVSANQVLAALSMDTVPPNILMAKSNLVSAQRSLDDLLQSNQTVAQAQRNLADAKQAVVDAQTAYDWVTGQRASAELLNNINDQIDQSRKQLDFLDFIYRRFYANLPDKNVDKLNFFIRITQVKQNLTALVARFNWFSAPVKPIDADKAQAALDLAKAQEGDAQRAVDRLQNGAVDEITAARARVAADQSILDQAKIIAPFAGTVTRAEPQPGDQIKTGAIAFRVDDLSHLVVDLLISEVDINSVAQGQAVSVSFDAIPDKTYKGTVTRVNLSASPGQNGVNYLVSVDLIDPDEQVKPGMTALVAVAVKTVENALLAPNRALRSSNGQHYVFVLKNNQAVPVNIRLGASSATFTQVVGGDLKEGDLIILNPPSATALAVPASPTATPVK